LLCYWRKVEESNPKHAMASSPFEEAVTTDGNNTFQIFIQLMVGRYPHFYQAWPRPPNHRSGTFRV
jgi:hypothetical protein